MMSSTSTKAIQFLTLSLYLFLQPQITEARYLPRYLPRSHAIATATLIGRDATATSSPVPTALTRTLAAGGSQWVSLEGTTTVHYDITVLDVNPVWTASETNFLTVIPPTASNDSPSTVYFSFLTGTPATTSGQPTAEPSIQAVVIAPALVPILQRIISSGGGDKTNDTLDEQIVAALAARGYEAWNAEGIPGLGDLITFLRFNFGTDPNAGLKLTPYLDLNQGIPGAAPVLTTTTEEPVITAIPEPAYPYWQFQLPENLYVIGPLPTDDNLDTPYTSTSLPAVAPTPTCFPGPISAKTSDAITFANEFCQAASGGNDSISYYQWESSNNYLSLAYVAFNGSCNNDCSTSFANTFHTCKYYFRRIL